MPRTRRIIQADSALHIMCRGNNKQNIFNNDSDKLYYWRLLGELKDENRLDIFHYCIMDNHVHLIVWITGESDLSRFMKQLSLAYYSYYKKLYNYCGHVWQGRFKSNMIENDVYLLQCGKYIELNPVRAGMVGYPGEYIFSSYRHYAFGVKDALIKDSPVFINLTNSPAERMKRYAAFMVDNDIINSDKLAKEYFLGSEAFVTRWRQIYGFKEVKLKGGRPKKKL